MLSAGELYQNNCRILVGYSEKYDNLILEASHSIVVGDVFLTLGEPRTILKQYLEIKIIYNEKILYLFLQKRDLSKLKRIV